MKLELAVLPLEVWADIFLSEYNWISRQELAEFANKMKNRNFADKLDKLLHGCGQHTLHYLHTTNIPWEWNAELRAYLRVSYHSCGMPAQCEFPETEMPDNIKSFKELSIKYLDDDVLDFLTKIKPLFSNVYLDFGQMSAENEMRILFTHFLPMLGGICKIRCYNDCVELLERHFPGTLTMTKELELSGLQSEPASIPVYLRWLNAPQDFAVDGPRFLTMLAKSTTITAMVDAVCQHFMAATTTSTFVVFLQLTYNEWHFRAEERTVQNAATNEQLTIRNALFNEEYWVQQYVEIVRHPAGANAKVREWIEQRAYYEKTYKDFGYEKEQVISISTDGWCRLTIGHITKNADGVNQAEDKPADDAGDEAGPSTSAKQMKKK